MPRPTQTDYAGARGRLRLEQLPRLGSGYLVQPKLDGQYVRVTTDRTGRIANVFSRTGRPVAPKLWRDITDPIAAPHSDLVGELEAHTEAGERAARARGFRLIHLFDALRVGGAYLAREPYHARRDALCRAHYALGDNPRELPWHNRYRDACGRYLPSPEHGPGRTPIVPQLPLARAEDLWADVERGELEGLVVVAQGAPVGARRSKLKVKPTDTIDCRVIRVSPRSILVEYGGQAFAMGRARHEVAAGSVVEVAFDGWLETAPIPKHPRLVRVRADLM